MPAGVTNAQGTTEYLGAAQHDAQMADHVTALTRNTPGILPEVALAIAHDPSFTYHNMDEPRPDNAFHVAHGVMGIHVLHQIVKATIPSGPSNLDGPVGQGAPTGGPIGPPQQQPNVAGQPNGPEGMGIASQNPTGLLGQVANAVSSTATDPTSDWDILHDSLYAPANNAVNEGLTQGFHGISTAFQDANLIGASLLAGGNQGMTNDILNQEGKGLTDALGAAAQGMNWVKTAAVLPSKIGIAGEAAANTALGLGGSYKQNQQALAMSNDQQLARVQGLPIIHQIQQAVNGAMNLPQQEYRYAQGIYNRTHDWGQVAIGVAGSLGPQAVVAIATGGLAAPEEFAFAAGLDDAIQQTTMKLAAPDITATEEATQRGLLQSLTTAKKAIRMDEAAANMGPRQAMQLGRSMFNAPSLLANYAGAEATGHVFHSDLWQQAYNAQTWAKSNPNGYATVGRGLASGIGLTKGTPAYNAVSGVTDFLASWTLPDVLGSAGRIIGKAHTAEGLALPGLSKIAFFERMQSGFALTHATDVYQWSPGFRSWVKWAVSKDTTAADIVASHPELSEVADQLENAKVYNLDGSVNATASRENLVKLFSDHQFATQITTTGTLPYKSWYTMLRDMSKDRVLNPFHAGTSNPMWLRGEGAKIGVETEFYVPGDRKGIPGLTNSLRQFLPADVTKLVVNQLYKADNWGMEKTVLGNAWRGMLQQSMGEELFNTMGRGLTDAQLATIDYVAGQKIDEIANRLTGSPASLVEDRAYGTNDIVRPADKVNGEWVAGPESRPQALYSGQLQHFALPNYHEVKALTKEVLVAAKVFIAQDGARKEFQTYVERYANGDHAATGMVPQIWRHASSAHISEELIQKRIVGLDDVINKYYNNRFFKPLALSTGGWAVRVSLSEDFLNILRNGGIKFVGAKIAGMAGRDLNALVEREPGWGFKTLNATTRNFENNVQALARGALNVVRKEALPAVGPHELTHLVAALMDIRLGLSAFALRTIGENTLMENATRLLLLHDGHIVNPAFDSTRHQNEFVTLGDRKLPTADNVPPWEDVKPGYHFGGDVPSRSRGYSMKGSQGNVEEYNRFIRGRWDRARFISHQPENVMDAYVGAYRSTGSHADALAASQKEAHRILLSNPSLYNPASFDRARSLGWETTTGDPMLDWSHSLAEDQQSLVYKRLADGRTHYDAGLASAIAEKRVPNRLDDFAGKYHSGVDPAMFNPVPMPDSLDKAASGWSFRKAADYLHNRVLGRVVNSLSRDPTYLIEYSKELKALKETTESGALNKVQAEVLAETRATHTMGKFVHNPYDKLKFEEGVRTWAPFYFAQNQAWRRVIRLARVNPGAFEQYIKMAMGYSHGISLLVGKNGTPIVSIPGTSWVNQAIEGFFTGSLGGAAIGFGANVSTLQTVVPIPYDSTSNDANPLQSFIPRLGNSATMPIKYLEDQFLKYNWFGKAALAQGIAKRILGSSEQYPIGTDLIPNTALQHLAELAAGTILGDKVNFSYTQSFAATNIETLKYYMTTNLEKYVKKDGPVAGYWNFLQWISQPKNQGAISSDAFRDTVFLHALEVGGAATLPVSVSTEAPFQNLVARYQALIKKDNGDVVKANTTFLNEYPGYLGLTLPMSKSASSVAYPESAHGLDWLLNNRGIVNDFPSLAGVLVPSSTRKDPYDQSAYSTEIMLGWRVRDIPSDFQSSFTNNVANNIIWNFVDPEAEKIYAGKDNFNGQTGYTGYEAFLNSWETGPYGIKAIDPTYTPINADVKQHDIIHEAILAAQPSSPYSSRADVKFVAAIAELAQQGLGYKDSTIKSTYTSSSPKTYFYNTWGPWWRSELAHVATTGQWSNGNSVVEGLTPEQDKALASRLGYAISGMANIMPVFTSSEWKYSG
jgi:hypothetical protein